MSGLKDSFLRRFSTVSVSATVNSFAVTAEAAATVDKALASIENELFSAIDAAATDPVTLKVPRLSINPTQTRFNFDDNNEMALLFRDVTRQLWDALSTLIADKKASGIYINGPQGIGKSHAMYGCACVLRMLRPKVRVTYIQSCEQWVKSHGDDPFRFLLNELCSTFQNDKISDDEDKPTVIKWADWVTGADPDVRDGRFKKMKIALNSFVNHNELCWITLVDQENALHSDSHLIERQHAAGTYPFNIIRSFSSKVIVSASANNEAFRKLPIDGWSYFDFTSLTSSSDSSNKDVCLTSYTSAEFELVIADECKANDDALEDVKYWTNQVPLEVTQLLRKDGDSLKAKLVDYKQTRSEQFRRRHRQFLDDSDPSQSQGPKIQSFRHALACTVLSLQLEDDTCLDRQLMFMHGQHAHALTPLALKVMRDLSPDDNKQAMDAAFELVLKDATFTNDVKGRVLEQYVVTCLERGKLWSGSAVSSGPQGGKRKPLKMKVGIEKVVHFVGSHTPVNGVDLDQSIMFVPLNSNYPAVDLLVWDANNKTLFAIQVTIREKVSDHMKETLADDGKWTSLKQQWRQFCGAEQIELIWLSDNDARGTFHEELLMQLEDVKNMFPLLSKFKRNKK